MKMKKVTYSIGTLVSCAALALSLAACGGDADNYRSRGRYEEQERAEVETVAEATPTGAAATEEELPAIVEAVETPVETLEDGGLPGNYRASMFLGDDFFREYVGDELGEAFVGADLSLDVLLDLDEDGSGLLSFDMEGFCDDMMDWVDDNFYQVMMVAFASEGYGEDELAAMIKAAGYSDIYSFLDDYKDEMMAGMESSLSELENDEYEMEISWDQAGSKLMITQGNGLGSAFACALNADGSITMHFDEDESPFGDEMDLIFKK